MVKAAPPYQVSKGTIRFPLSKPVPVKLIEGIAKFLAKEAAARVRAKQAGTRDGPHPVALPCG